MPILLTSGGENVCKNVHEILHFNSAYVVTEKNTTNIELRLYDFHK